jgi:SAM-dependent methyltransferase
LEPTISNDQIILEHYKKVAKSQGLLGTSTIQDPVIRDAEIDFFLKSIQKFGKAKGHFNFSVLDIGCGNGILLSKIKENFPTLELYGMEFSPDLLRLAKSRKLDGVNFFHGDARLEESYPKKFDVILSERSIINILEAREQKKALYNIADSLVVGGMYFQSESYFEPLVNLNRARREMKLDNIEPSKHNRFLREFNILALRDHKNLVETDSVLPSNYLSTHFFVSRILHQLIRPEGGKVKYSHLVSFMSEGFGPGVGNYSPILFRSFNN